MIDFPDFVSFQTKEINFVDSGDQELLNINLLDKSKDPTKMKKFKFPIHINQRRGFMDLYEQERKFGLQMFDYYIYLTLMTAAPYLVGMLFRVDIFEYITK